MRGLAAPLALALVGLGQPVAAQPENPVAWVIRDHQTIRDRDLQFGDIRIQSGGVLELLNSTITFVVPGPFEPTLAVEEGGRLYLNGTDGRPSQLVLDRAGIPNPDPYYTRFRWALQVKADGLVGGRGCVIAGTGINENVNTVLPATPRGLGRGFFVNGSLLLANCILIDHRTEIAGEERTRIYLDNVSFYAQWPYNHVLGSIGDIALRRVHSDGGTMHFGKTVDVEGLTIINAEGRSALSFARGASASLRNLTLIASTRDLIADEGIRVQGPAKITIEGARMQTFFLA